MLGLAWAEITGATFAIGGGYAGARAAGALSAQRVPIAVAMAACGVVAVWAVLVAPTMAMFGATLILAWCLLILGAVDALVLRLPDILTLPLVVAGIAVATFLPMAVQGHETLPHLAGAVAGFCVFAAIGWGYRVFRGREGLGLGDAKLLAAAGAWLGWQPLPSVVLIAGVTGLAYLAAAWLVRRRSFSAERFPFGTTLCFAIWVVWLYGPLTPT